MTTAQMTTKPITTTSILETTELETTMSTTRYSTVPTVTTTILSTAPSMWPTNTSILIIHDLYSRPDPERHDNYLLDSNGGKIERMKKNNIRIFRSIITFRKI